MFRRKDRYLPIAQIVTRPKRPRPSASIVSTMQVGHGWTLPGSGVGQTDTTDFFLGTQSIKFVTGGTGASNNLVSPAAGFTTVDLDAVDPIVWVKVQDWSTCAHFYIKIGSTAGGTTDLYQWDLRGGVAQEWCIPGVWVPVTLTKSMATVVGTPNAAAIQWCSVRVIDTSAGAGQGCTVWFNGLGFQTKQAVYPNGVISFSFDDGRASQYSVAKPIMDKYLYVGNAHPTWSDLRDFSGSSSYMTLAQLELMHADGWEVSCQAFNSVLFADPQPGLTATGSQADILSEQQAIADQGWTGYQIGSYPHGSFYTNPSGGPSGGTSTGDIMARFREIMVAMRSIWPSSSTATAVQRMETLPPADPLRLRVGYVQNTTTLATVEAWVDACKADKAWLILVLHNIAATAPNSTDWLTADFTSLVDYIAAAGVSVVPMSQVLKAAA